MIKIDVLYGMKVIEPVQYKLRRLPGGRGILESEFMSLEGEFSDLLRNAPLLGGRVAIVDGASG